MSALAYPFLLFVPFNYSHLIPSPPFPFVRLDDFVKVPHADIKVTENMSTMALHQPNRETYDEFGGVWDEDLDEIECLEEALKGFDGDDGNGGGEAVEATGVPMAHPEALADRLSHQSIIGSGPSTEPSVPLLPSATGIVASFWKSCPSELMGGVKELLARPQPAFNPDVPNPILVKHAEFTAEEVRISRGRIEHLVSPTGTLVDRMGILLHWPTFSTTSNWNFPRTGDVNAKCLKPIFEKGIPLEGTLFLDSYARVAGVLSDDQRMQYRTPMSAWSSELRKLHEQWSQWVFEASHCKIWLVLGRANRLLLQARYKKRLVNFSVDVQDLKVKVSVLFSLQKKKVLCMIIWTFHPEALMHKKKYPVGALMDASYNLAAALLGIQVGMTYFKDYRPEYPPSPLTTLIFDLASEAQGFAPKTTYEELAPSIKCYLKRNNLDAEKLRRYPSESLSRAIHRHMSKQNPLRVLIDLQKGELDGAPPITEYHALPGSVIRWLEKEGYGGDDEVKSLLRPEHKGSLVRAIKSQMSRKGGQKHPSRKPHPHSLPLDPSASLSIGPQVSPKPLASSFSGTPSSISSKASSQPLIPSLANGSSPRGSKLSTPHPSTCRSMIGHPAFIEFSTQVPEATTVVPQLACSKVFSDDGTATPIPPPIDPVLPANPPARAFTKSPSTTGPKKRKRTETEHPQPHPQSQSIIDTTKNSLSVESGLLTKPSARPITKSPPTTGPKKRKRTETEHPQPQSITDTTKNSLPVESGLSTRSSACPTTKSHSSANRKRRNSAGLGRPLPKSIPEGFLPPNTVLSSKPELTSHPLSDASTGPNAHMQQLASRAAKVSSTAAACIMRLEKNVYRNLFRFADENREDPKIMEI